MSVQDQNFWIFLCFGQSNMAGQAPIEQQDLMVSDRFFSMATTDGPDRQLGTWRKAVPPLCRADANLGPADWFGRTLLEVAPALPLLVGEVVRSEYGGICGHANPTINDMVNRYPNTYVVSSEGCLPCDDYLHFSGEGYRLLGRHYALRYLETTNPQLAEVCRKKIASANIKL